MKTFLTAASVAIALSLISFSSSQHAVAAEDCASIRAQIFGSGPNDMQSAAYKYRNYKEALAKTQFRLSHDEDTLEVSRTASAAYFLKYGKTDPLLEFRLSTGMNRVREDRDNERYFSEKLAVAAARLTRLNAEYKRLDCAGNKPLANRTLDISGTWAVECCNDRWSWTLSIKQEGNTFSGSMSGPRGGQVTNGEVSGETIEFDRLPTMCTEKQHWSGHLVHDSKGLRIINGTWSGCEDARYPGQTNWHAEKT